MLSYCTQFITFSTLGTCIYHYHMLKSGSGNSSATPLGERVIRSHLWIIRVRVSRAGMWWSHINNNYSRYYIQTGTAIPTWELVLPGCHTDLPDVRHGQGMLIEGLIYLTTYQWPNRTAVASRRKVVFEAGKDTLPLNAFILPRLFPFFSFGFFDRQRANHFHDVLIGESYLYIDNWINIFSVELFWNPVSLRNSCQKHSLTISQHKNI